MTDIARPLCGAKRHRCANDDCDHRYPAAEFELDACPDCGEPRACRNLAGWGTDHSGTGRCKYHAGIVLKGAEHPSYKDGSYSKYLPKDMVGGYLSFMRDPKRLSLDSEMALVRTLVADRISALREFNSAQAWETLGKTYADMMAAQRQGQKERFASALLELGDIIKGGAGHASNRRELRELVETERKLVDTQRQLLVDMGEFITRGMALTMLGSFLEAVKTHVIPLEGGAHAINAISSAIRGMVGELGGRATRNGSDESIDAEFSVAK
jgi:hypothetical protein